MLDQHIFDGRGFILLQNIECAGLVDNLVFGHRREKCEVKNMDVNMQENMEQNVQVDTDVRVYQGKGV